MISREDLENSVIYTYDSDTLFEWFIRQDSTPLLDDYSELYQNFIKEVISLYEKERNDTFFFSGVSLLNNNSKNDIIYIDNFKIDTNKLIQ